MTEIIIKVEKNGRVRKPPFCNNYPKNYHRQIYWMLKARIKVYGETKYLHVFKVSCHRLLTIYKGINKYF